MKTNLLRSRTLGTILSIALILSMVAIAAPASPVQALTAATVTVSPTTASAPASYTIVFTTAMPLDTGDEIRITFPSGTGNLGSIPADNITVNGVSPSAVSDVTTMLRLTLTDPIAAGTVTVVFNGLNKITNPVAGGYTLNIWTTMETSGIDSNIYSIEPPTFGSATTNVAGTGITITLSKVMADPAGKHGSFKYQINGGADQSFSAAALNATTTKIDLTCSGTTIVYGNTVTVSYTAGTVAAADNSRLATFTASPVFNNVPALPPAFVWAATNTAGTIITVAFSKAMTSPVGKHTEFSYKINGGTAQTFSAAALNTADTTKIELTCSGTAIAAGDTVTVSYTLGTVTSSDGGVLATFSNQPVTNNMPGPPTFVSATTNTAGTVITITFSKNMASPVGKEGEFKYKINAGAVQSFSAATLDAVNTKINLTCSGTAIAYGNTVTVSYTAGTVTAADTSVLASFTDQSVTNGMPAPATTSVTLVSPTGGTDTAFYVKQGGTVPVTYLLAGPGGDSNTLTIWIQSTAGSVIGQTFATKASGTTYTTNVPLNSVVTAGSYNIRINDGNGHELTNPAVAVDAVRVRSGVPSLTLCYPEASGISVRGGATDNITYNVTCDNMTGRNVLVTAKLSDNAGTSYGTTLFGPTMLPQKSASCSGNLTVTWPAIDKTNCKVSLIVTDNVSNTVTDNSTNVFAIISSIPAVTVVTPNDPGIVLDGGSTYSISYYVTAPYSSTICRNIQLQTVSPVVTENITNNWLCEAPGPVKNVSWTVPNNRRGTDNFTIKVTAYDIANNSGWDVSDNPFTIRDVTKPSASVIFPKANETKYAGATCNITWSASDNIPGDNLTYCWFYSTSGNVAANYLPIACTTPPAERQATTANPIVKSWAIPASDNSTNCYVKVQATDQSGNSDNSTPIGPFTILNLSGGPRVSLTSPVGGETWLTGSAHTINFNGAHNSGDVSVPIRFVISLSTDSGANYSENITILNDGTQGPRMFTWAVPDKNSATCRVRVRAIDPQGLISDNASTADFTISPATNPVETANIDLPVGWSYFSLPLIPTSTVRHSVLATVMDKVNSVWSFDPPGTWKVYYPGSISGSLIDIVDGKGYMIDMREAGTLTFQGIKCLPDPAPRRSYSVVAGENLIGFKSTDNVTVSVYLSGTTYNPNIEGKWGGVSNYSGLSDNLTTGHGYWVNFTQTGLIYPGCR